MIHNKYLLLILGFGLFACAAVLGFYGPDWYAVQKDKRARLTFEVPPMPAKTLAAFSQEFAKVRTATEPITLPDQDIAAPDGKPIRLSSFEGKPLLVNFWATWCAPCVVELPSLHRFAEHYEGRLQVIAISLDPMKKQSDIASFLEKRQIGAFAGYFDEKGDFARELSLHGIPTSFLIGKDGRILYRFEGDADWTSAATKAFFDTFLADSGQQNGE